MKVQVTKGKYKGTRGTVVGVYLDGRYDIKVTHRKANQPKYQIVKTSHCREIR